MPYIYSITKIGDKFTKKPPHLQPVWPLLRNFGVYKEKENEFRIDN